MAVANKFNNLSYHLGKGVHDLSAHQLKLVLCNTAPVATNTLLSDLTQIAASGGYVADGFDLTETGWTTSGGLAKLTIADASPLFTATGTVTLRYFALYNTTTTALVKPLICWWDHGSTLTLNSGDPLTWDVVAADGLILQF